MKKIIVACVLICSMLALTACGGNEAKTLVCTQTAAGVDIELTTRFGGKKVDDMKMKYTMDVSKYNETQLDAIKAQDFCTLVKNSMIGYGNAFSNCKQNIDNGKLLITADFDIDKIEDDSIKAESTPEEAKAGLESTGYSCVIK